MLAAIPRQRIVLTSGAATAAPAPARRATGSQRHHLGIVVVIVCVDAGGGRRWGSGLLLLDGFFCRCGLFLFSRCGGALVELLFIEQPDPLRFRLLRLGCFAAAGAAAGSRRGSRGPRGGCGRSVRRAVSGGSVNPAGLDVSAAGRVARCAASGDSSFLTRISTSSVSRRFTAMRSASSAISQV